MQLKRSIHEYLEENGLDKARPEVQAALAAASGRLRDMPQHRGFLVQPASHLKRRSLDAGEPPLPVLQPRGGGR